MITTVVILKSLDIKLIKATKTGKARQNRRRDLAKDNLSKLNCGIGVCMVNSRLCETARSPVSKFETETLRLRDLSQSFTNTAQRPETPRPTFFEEPFYTLKWPKEWLAAVQCYRNYICWNNKWKPKNIKVGTIYTDHQKEWMNSKVSYLYLIFYLVKPFWLN